jgi:hypothetical protein
VQELKDEAVSVMFRSNIAFGWVNIVKYKETKKFLMKEGGWNTW